MAVMAAEASDSGAVIDGAEISSRESIQGGADHGPHRQE
jgi:hypothetical protein